jgi:hypothetical protein
METCTELLERFGKKEERFGKKEASAWRRKSQAILALKDASALMRAARAEASMWKHSEGAKFQWRRHWAFKDAVCAHIARIKTVEKTTNDIAASLASESTSLDVENDNGAGKLRNAVAALEREVAHVVQGVIADDVYDGRLSAGAVHAVEQARDILFPPDGDTERLERRVERLERKQRSR